MPIAIGTSPSREDTTVAEADAGLLIEELKMRIEDNEALRYELKEELDLVDTTVAVSDTQPLRLDEE